MKKHARRILSFCLLAALLVTLAVPAAAATISHTLLVGEEQTLLFSEEPYISSDPSVVEVRAGDTKHEYVAVAKSAGTATLTGTWAGKEVTYDITVNDSVLPAETSNNPIGQLIASLAVLGVAGSIVLIFAAILFIAGLAAVIYIFFAAPKCGMSRWWALLPLVSNVMGLFIFIVIRSKRRTEPDATGKNTITCPVCNTVHHKGTKQCSVCGNDLS